MTKISLLIFIRIYGTTMKGRYGQSSAIRYRILIWKLGTILTIQYFTIHTNGDNIIYIPFNKIGNNINILWHIKKYWKLQN